MIRIVCLVAMLVFFGGTAVGYDHTTCKAAAPDDFIARFLADHTKEGQTVSVDFEKSEKGLVEVRPGAQVYYDYVVRLRITYDKTTKDEIGSFSLWTSYYTRHAVTGFCWVHGTSKYISPTPLYNPDRW